MAALDWSANGTLADEAIYLGTILTFVSSILTVMVRQGRIARQVNNIDSNLNHVGEPEPDSGPTVAQRITKIETHVDRVDQKLDRIGSDLQNLSFHMMQHISDEARRTDRLEEKVQQLDRRRDWEADHGDTQPR